MKGIAIGLVVIVGVAQAQGDRVVSEAAEIEQMRRETALEEMKAELYQAKTKTQELGRSLGTVSDVPELVGIMSAPDGARVAEFRRGRGVIRMRAGDQLSTTWQVTEVRNHNVVLRDREGVQRIVSFGVDSAESAPVTFGPSQPLGPGQ